MTPDEVKKTRVAVDRFRSDGGMGPILQEHLNERALDPGISNWLEDLWAESYLCNPLPLPTNSNVTFIIEKNPLMKKQPLPEFLATLIMTLFEFNKLILSESLEVDYQKNNPLCMAQYRTLLSTTRIPGEFQDSHITASGSAHVIILHRGHYYRLDVLDQHRNILGYGSLLHNIRVIMQTPKTNCALPVGILTNLPRRKWAQLRKRLAAISPGNKNSLHHIESALAFFVIDEAIPENDAQLFKHFFLGNAANRWYDKSLQFILNEAGDLGINYEHSGVDGTTLGRLVSYLYETMSPHEVSAETAVSAPADEILFDLTDRLISEIEAAAIISREAFHDHVFETLVFSEFGKGRIKTLGVSPDSFVQIGLQLAQQHALHNIYNVYESVMTKRFRYGRTETMRPVTRESVLFVKNPTREHLKAASMRHVERINECQNGRGIDRHLYGLKTICQKYYPKEPLPEIFSSPGYKTISTNHFSTSTSGSLAMRYAGYGPLIEDGFAARYLIYDDRLHFVLSSKKHRAEDLLRFKASLDYAFKVMAALP